MTEIKHLLNGLIHLDTINLEEKLAEAPSLKVLGDNIFIDLSKCQFAELGAMTQLILIIESFLKSEHTVYFALPTTKLTERQAKSDKNLEKGKASLILQTNVTKFLKITGFISALQEIAKIHNNEIYFTENYDYKKKGEGINIEAFKESYSVIYDDINVNDDNYKFLLPFRWIDCQSDIEEVKEFEEKLDKVLENEKRGLENFDAQVIKNVILSELIKNVKVHAKTKYAIFVVGLIQTHSIVKERRLKKFNSIEQEHLSHISNSNIESQVEIYFGDSGIGLLNEVYKEKINEIFALNKSHTNKLLEYSFNKWSSIQDNEPRRGTKGLYRLKRIVDKYKGIVHIKSSMSNGGYFNNEFYYREFSPSFKGTFLSIKLNPFKEIKSFKLSSLKRPQRKEWKSSKIILNKDLKCLEKIRDEILHENNILLITEITSIDLSKDSKTLEDFFYEVSFITHPSAIVLYLISNNKEVDNDTIETLIESVQTRINESQKEAIDLEIETSNFEEVHDPVLVIGSHNNTFWYGGGRMLINIINDAYSLLDIQSEIVINDLMTYKKLSDENRIEIKNYLESNSSLVVLNENEELEFNFLGIERHYENKIRGFKPKILDKKVCTPKLNIANQWINITELLKDDEYGFALCLYLKYRKNLEQNGTLISRLDGKNTFILIDHSQQYNLTKKFAELLGLKLKNIRNIEEEIDYTSPKRAKIFNDYSRVIILTTVLSSSETIRRMVKYVKRDLALPDIVLCLMNYRKSNTTELETWNDVTKIISVYQKNNIEEEKIDRNSIYFESKFQELLTVEKVINPNFEIETPKILSEVVKIDNEILDFFSEHNLVHYNHYGHYNKRHFTFFLNKKGILNTESDIIINKIEKAILSWQKQRNIVDFSFYINKNSGNHFLHFIQKFKTRFSNNIEAIDIKSKTLQGKNSIYFDFGIITGESINYLINQAEGIENLFVCLLFNQAINSNATSYKKISTLRYLQNTSLLEQEEKTINFDIEYLYDFPLSFFNSENCPICEHRRALDNYKLDEPYFTQFSNDRRERLKQNLGDDIYELKYPVDFYYSNRDGEKKQELSKEIIRQMYELKIHLENALKFTKFKNRAI